MGYVSEPGSGTAAGYPSRGRQRFRSHRAGHERHYLRWELTTTTLFNLQKSGGWGKQRKKHKRCKKLQGSGVESAGILQFVFGRNLLASSAVVLIYLRATHQNLLALM